MLRIQPPFTLQSSIPMKAVQNTEMNRPNLKRIFQEDQVIYVPYMHFN